MKRALLTLAMVISIVAQPLPSAINAPRIAAATAPDAGRGIVQFLETVGHALAVPFRALSGFADSLNKDSDQKAASSKPTRGPQEVASARTRDSKLFRLADGRYQAQFERGMNYESSPGKWSEVDPTIREAGSADCGGRPQIEIGGDNYDLCMVRGSYKAHISRSALGPLRLEQPGHAPIIIRAVGANESQAFLDGPKATYFEAWKGVDWLRIMSRDGVKSVFALKDSSSIREFHFRVHAPGLTPRPNTDGSVELIQAGRVVARIEAPFAMDSADLGTGLAAIGIGLQMGQRLGCEISASLGI